LTHTVV